MLAREHLKALADGEKIHPIDILGGSSLGIAGRIFWVMPSTNSVYARFFKDHNEVDPEARTNSVYNTVDAAISACVAARGDVVLVTPGHTETVTATSIAHDVSGVQVIGLGIGNQRPVFTYGAAAATITVSAASCAWRNVVLVANFLNVAAAFTVGAAADFTVVGCAFRDTSSILNFLSAVVTGSTNNDADGLTVIDNVFRGSATTQNAFVSILANESRVLIQGNDVFMAATNDAGHFVTLSSKIMDGIRILRNSLTVVGATSSAVGIFLTGSGTTSTGLVAYNLVSSLDTTAELIATAGTGLSFFENYYTGTADASGKLWPVVDGA